jgi:MFS transporter, DHA2 family, multidrug resistance protein
MGLAVLGLPTALIAVDMSVLFMALPRLSAALRADSVQQVWISDIYGFVIAGFLITMGALGDRIGRRRLLLIGGAAFAVASTLAAYSTSPVMLIGMRALMGLAGATLMPSTLTLIRNMFSDEKQYGTAMGVWVGCFTGGMAVGPAIGGALLDYFWWGSVFLLAIPVMVVLLAVGPRVLPEFRARDTSPIDVISSLLSLATILLLILGLTQLATYGFAIGPVAAVIAGVVLGIVFVHRQHTLASPLVDLSLLRNHTFRVAATLSFFSANMAGIDLFIYQYLQEVQGLSPLATGLWLLPANLAAVASSQFAPLLARRIRPGYAISGGLVVMSAGCVLLTQLSGRGDLPLVVASLLAMSIGLGPIAALGMGLAVGSVPMEQAGIAASVNQTGIDLGVAVGLAVLGTVGTTVYRLNMGAGQVGRGVPTAAAAVAHQSVAGGVSVARQLPGAAGVHLLLSARSAFAGAIHAVGVGGTLITLGLAVLAITALRHVPPAGSAEAGQAGSEQAPTEVDPLTSS